MQIAVDGPSASGKGTIAKGLATHFGLPHLDTGLLYRAVGKQVAGIDNAQIEEAAVAAAIDIAQFELNEEELGRPEVALLAAKVARIESVRAALRQFQIDFAAQAGGAVLDGRDIGTRIMAEAPVKLFIDADVVVRARRRFEQLVARGVPVTYEEIESQIRQRDESDRSNPAGAFFRAKDAHLLDTSKLDIEAAIRAAIEIAASVQAKMSS